MNMKDQLSAFMDGEIALSDAQHLMTGVSVGGELKQAWQHYHLIGDAMRGDVHMHHDMTTRIMGAIESEPTILAPGASRSNASADKPARGFQRRWSMVASVAAVMFVGVMVWQNQEFQADDMAPVQIAQEVPVEYLAAHHAAASSGVSYYIQPATYSESK